MTLELWVSLDGGRDGLRGQLVKRRVDLAGRTTKVHLDTDAWVRGKAIDAVDDIEFSMGWDLRRGGT